MRKYLSVTYIALDPLKYPRIEKIACSLKKCKGIRFNVMIPRFKFVYRGGKIGRLFSALLNYFIILFQISCTNADFLWVANCPDILVLPLILRRKRYILEYRSPWPIEVEREFGIKQLARFANFFERLALKHAWIITLTTSKLIDRVRIFNKPVFVIPNYPLSNFGKSLISREEFRKQYGYSEKDKIVLFVGKLTSIEGADLLPKIISNCLKREDRIVFWIVGDGPLYKTLKVFAGKFPGRVKLFGWQSHERIPNFIEAADVCIAPRHESPYSIFYNEEGVSKISEYMFFKKPIVACGVAESSEYLLVKEDEMADGILKALHSEVPCSKRRTWEEYSEKRIHEMFNLILSGKI